MRRKGKIRQLLLAVNHFAVFFFLLAFVITCCMMLFVRTMVSTLNVELTAANTGAAAKLTLANVLLLTLLCTLMDYVRRKLTVDRPVRRITDAAKRIMHGDFSVRIPSFRFEADDKFGEIADCMNRMAKELASIETLRTDFVANVSHELKTPLAIMKNYGTLLQQRDLPDDKRMEYAKAITAASGRLADLITNILRLNKLENQQIFPEAKPYDLSEQLCACLLGFEEAWEQKGLNIETDIEENVIVESDEEMMALVWNNLFSNAVKFTPIGGTVSLRLFTDAGDAVVEIGDTGCGISKEVGARIFDKFYQGDTSHAAQGNGLGLALVKRVVDITGSDISVKSEVGKGSIFTVRMRRKS